MLAIVAPGQGAQRPGLFIPWLDAPGVKEHIEELGKAADLDLLAAGTSWGAEALQRTQIAQPLVVAAALVSARLLHERGVEADVVAGHSVGEWAAAVLAGVLTEAEAMRLVAVRGRAMADACAEARTGMSAVMGGERIEVLNLLAELGLTPANNNGAGQIVAGGSIKALDALAAAAPDGVRVRRLPVAGAFHTFAMRPARTVLSDVVCGADAELPQIPFISNRDGGLIDAVYADGGTTADGHEVLQRLVDQVAAPVRWDRCTETLLSFGVTELIELAPAGVLAGLARRSMPGVEVIALDSPQSVPDRRQLQVTQ